MRQRRAAHRRTLRDADHERLRLTRRERGEQRARIDPGASAPRHEGTLMIVVRTRDGEADVTRVRHGVGSIVLSPPLMRHPTRHRFARGSEGDDREEAGRDQPAEEGATHNGKLVGSVPRRSSRALRPAALGASVPLPLDRGRDAPVAPMLGGAGGSYQACALTAPAASISTVSNVATSSQAPL
jgi:hypothetical protein